jgi:protein-L-isoaspartate(D-aspartate) O-methyltransferase
MGKEEMISRLKGMVGESVVEAMAAVPREIFVADDMKREAYNDTPLPIGYGQTISAPHMVAIMCHILDLRPGMKVLEVGAGCGYHAAVMAYLVGARGHVYAIERIAELALMARENLARAEVNNVSVIHGDGSLGLPEHAPFDRISVAASAPTVPAPLKDQLKIGGLLVIPVGSIDQQLMLVRRVDGFEVKRYMGVIFVPLIGEHGFSEG